ncbi:hypothetical protein FNV43_RR01603 [Rhamnella rubrinervis]|uniref:Uncharacterized protein n=1 Tax=Rhamnella rubrinervis TaxID=2594499 RepID=A0A8K0MT08_9ROSA|nr:hypothetical protein FNV43_RR01603 [Rhamnella rubrinervis]
MKLSGGQRKLARSEEDGEVRKSGRVRKRWRPSRSPSRKLPEVRGKSGVVAGSVGGRRSLPEASEDGRPEEDAQSRRLRSEGSCGTTQEVDEAVRKLSGHRKLPEAEEVVEAEGVA